MNAKVYTVVKGLEVAIGGYGVANNDQPVVVPDEVADQLEAEIRGHRVIDGVEIKYSKEAIAVAKRLRVERMAVSKPASKLSAEELRKVQPSEVEKQ
jgi:hypothetical protein